MTQLTNHEALTIVRSGLQKVPSLWSPSGEAIVFATGAKESHFKYVRQLGGGPALGYFQMEPFTHDDIWKNYLAYRPTIMRAVRALGSSAEDLIRNPEYAAVMCRMKYVRDKFSLPAPGDYLGMAQTWKRVYNSDQGKGKLDAETIEIFRKAIEYVGKFGPKYTSISS